MCWRGIDIVNSVGMGQGIKHIGALTYFIERIILEWSL